MGLRKKIKELEDKNELLKSEIERIDFILNYPKKYNLYSKITCGFIEQLFIKYVTDFNILLEVELGCYYDGSLKEATLLKNLKDMFIVKTVVEKEKDKIEETYYSITKNDCRILDVTNLYTTINKEEKVNE